MMSIAHRNPAESGRMPLAFSGQYTMQPMSAALP